MKVIPHYSPCPDPITHEATEYVFEPGEVISSVSENVVLPCRTAEAATEELHRRLGALQHPLSQTIAQRLTQSRVCSIVVNTQNEVFYRVVLNENEEQWLLVQLCGPFPKRVGNIDLKQFPEFWEFLNTFRNVSSELPPYNNIWFGDGDSISFFDVCDVYDDDTPQHAERMGEWNHAIPLLFNGCGDYYLLSPAGRIGFRDHGCVNPLSASQKIALAKMARTLSGNKDSDQPIFIRPTPPLMDHISEPEFTEIVLKQLRLIAR